MTLRLVLVLFFGGIIMPVMAQLNDSTVSPANRPPAFKNAFVLGAEGNSYKGDLGRPYHKWSGGVYAGVMFNKKKRINAEVLFSYINITGQNTELTTQPDPDRKPNNYFKTAVFAGNVNVCFNFIKRDNYKIYLAQGVGVAWYSPKDEFGAKLSEQYNTRAEGEVYGSVAFSLPTRLGGCYFFPNGFGLQLETGFLNTMTDYLDNVSELGLKEGNDNVLFIHGGLVFPVPQSLTELIKRPGK